MRRMRGAVVAAAIASAAAVVSGAGAGHRSAYWNVAEHE